MFCFIVVKEGVVPHITQVCLMDMQKSNSHFTQYVEPKIPITEGATEVTGITYSMGTMKHHNTVVQCKSWSVVSRDLLCWLDEHVGQGQTVVLAAHNGRRFDFRVILIAMENVNLHEQFVEKVNAVVDTMKLFSAKVDVKESLKQEELYAKYIQKSYDAHDAKGDVLALIDLLNYFKISITDIMKVCFAPKALIHDRLFTAEKNRNFSSLAPIIACGVKR